MERMVTRTMTIATIEAMAVDTVSAEVVIKSYDVLQGNMKTEDDYLKYLRNHYETLTFKFVKIESIKKNTVLCGMSEEKFYSSAEILPNR